MNFSAKKMFFIDLLITIIGVLFDQFTKHLAVLRLKDQAPVSLIPGALELRYLENRGAAFGILQNQKIFFVLMTSLILLACIYALWRMPAARKYTMLHILGAIFDGRSARQFPRPYPSGLCRGFYLYQPDRLPDFQRS